jgi:hypothetical protein
MHIVEYATQEGFAAVSGKVVRLSSVKMLLDPCQFLNFPANSMGKIHFPGDALFVLWELY